MRTMLTSTEAARAVRISPSTFRAYVARSQAPRPRRTVGGVNLWSVADLARWRDLDLDREQRQGMRIDIAIMDARGREWEDATRRQLAQIRIAPRDAQRLIDDSSPGGMDLQTYLDAQSILETRRDLRRRLGQELGETEPPPIAEDSLLRATAEDVASGQDVFTALADLTAGLVTHGHGERLLPIDYDGSFWTAQDDADAFAAYLRSLPQVSVPEVG
jgi:DNA-binding transcriptional MerR regulator